MDNVYVISLPGNAARRAKMAKRMNYHQLNFQFIDAVTPDSDLVKNVYGVGSDLSSSRLSPELKCSIGREYSCFASHLLALKKIIDDNVPGAIILEDDALLVNDFTEKFLLLDKNTPLIMLYSEVICNETTPPGLHPVNNNWCTTGYWISLEYAKSAYDRFNVPFITMPHFKTSECITMFSGGKFILPQLILEDPLNISGIRDTRVDSKIRDYHRRFCKFIKWEDYSKSETPEYRSLLQNYFDFINHKDIGEISPINLDAEQQFFALFLNKKNTTELEMKNPSQFWWSGLSKMENKDSVIKTDHGIYYTEKYLKKNNFENGLTTAGTLYLSLDRECFLKNKNDDGSEFVQNPPSFLPDPMQEEMNTRENIKLHVYLNKEYDYGNYVSEKSALYILILQWYFAIYSDSKKDLLKLSDSEIDSLSESEKFFYFNLVLPLAWTQDREFGAKVCELARESCPPELVTIFAKNMGYYYQSKTVPQLPKLLILADSGLHYDSDSPKTGIFGSEEAVIYLSEILSKNYQVTICNRMKYSVNKFSLPGNNPRYTNLLTGDPKEYAVGILWRYFYDIDFLCQKIYSWHHDVWFGGPRGFDSENNQKLNGMFLLSKWQLGQFSQYSTLKNPILCGNGIIGKDFLLEKRNCKNPYSIVYTSCYARGLIDLLRIWPEVRGNYPQATLDLCYGWNLWNMPENEQLELKAVYETARKDSSITDHGKVGHQELITILKNSSIWAYPCNFYETFCITAVKMQACGVVPVVRNIGALEETVLDGYLFTDTNHFKPKLFQAMNEIHQWTDSRREILAKKAISRWGWDQVAAIWQNEFSK